MIQFLLESVLVTDCDGGEFQWLVVVDFDIDVDWVAPEVNDPVDYLIGHYCGTKQHQQCPKQPKKVGTEQRHPCPKQPTYNKEKTEQHQ